MNRKTNFILLALCLVLLGFSACASDPQQKAGFLSNYSKLTPTPYKNALGSMAYISSSNPPENFEKFILNPVQIRLTQKGRKEGVPRSKMRELANYFDKQLRKELSKSDYSIVNRAAPRTMLVRIALTNVEAANPLLNIHPATLISGMGLGGASIEAEFLDALTGEVVVAVMDTQKGSKGFDGLTKYGNAEDVIERWAKRLVIQMDAVHEKTRK